jgi:hypothetical protein
VELTTSKRFVQWLKSWHNQAVLFLGYISLKVSLDMTTFLFWNLNKRLLEDIVAETADLHHVDVLILAECEIPSYVMLEALNRNRTRCFIYRTASVKE